jgi:predicted regulator of Ras-like GTPase activity (Roadblock/LC7/MglB family)
MISDEQALPAVSKEKRSSESGKVVAMLAAALNSADQVLRDLNSVHSRKTAISSTDRTSPRVHAKTHRLNGHSKK